MRVLDLFSGIGGFSLGLERAGMQTVAFCEIDPFCRKVLAKHWPDVPIHEDITELDGEQYRGTVDLVCGGFPCQDLSDASHGKGAGMSGSRSGLWYQMARVISECRPRFCVVENVDGAAWKRWVPAVRSSLRELGYTSLSFRMRAVDLGAPFEGSRVFVAATHGDSKSIGSFYEEMAKLPKPSRRDGHWRLPAKLDLGVDDGIPGGLVRNRVAQLKAYGNAVVPQIPEMIGRAIVASTQGDLFR